MNPIEYFDTNGHESAVTYDRVNADELHAWMARFLPKDPVVVLDVGAGSGRDAAWLAQKGHHVIAVEPSRTMREYGIRTHAHENIRWVNDALPSLNATYQLQYSYDIVFVNAVWMFVSIADRPRAFRKLVELIKPGGLLIITAQLGDVDPKNGKIAVPDGEIIHLANQHGLKVEVETYAADALGRGYRWQQIVLRVPDDGTGAMPFLRRLVLDDRKSATYKLGLLRTVIRTAETASGFVQIVDDGKTAELPLGLFGLYWLRLYLPLTQGDFPQSPTNRHAGKGLSFAGAAYSALPANISTDLFLGNTFTGDRAKLLARAIRDACDCIQKMPAQYITYDDGRQVFDIQKNSIAIPETFRLDQAFLTSFGTVKVSRHIWMSIARFGFWMEPSVILEWQRLMNGYAASQNRLLDPLKMHQAMEWADFARDQNRARVLITDMQQRGKKIACIWSGKPLNTTYDVDHILPWVAWPCGDLWNLVPTDRALNQAEKRAKLISAPLLDAARERLYAFWTHAYVETGNDTLRQVFFDEAHASLLVQSPSLPLVHRGVHERRLQLRMDQQIPEFSGVAPRN